MNMYSRVVNKSQGIIRVTIFQLAEFIVVCNLIRINFIKDLCLMNNMESSQHKFNMDSEQTEIAICNLFHWKVD